MSLLGWLRVRVMVLPGGEGFFTGKTGEIGKGFRGESGEVLLLGWLRVLGDGVTGVTGFFTTKDTKDTKGCSGKTWCRRR